MKKNKTISIIMVVLLVISFSVSIIPQVGAADEGEIEASIVLGLEWLAGEQQAGGHWRYTDGFDDECYDFGTTGIVLLKFCDRAKELELDPFDSGEYDYAVNVIAGFDYIFDHVIVDADGVHTNCFWDVYITSCLMMAIASSDAPGRSITTGPLATTQTYSDALQGMMDWMAFAQIDDTSPCEVGGWGYYPANYGYADNSVSGYATLGIGFAAAPSPYGFGLTIPPVVLTQLDEWIDIVQDDVNGGSIYRPCQPWAMINILKTGNLLYEMSLVGDDFVDARVQNAIGYIEDHWGDTGTNPDYPPASLGWMDSYQAMFSMMRGLVAFGITELDNGGPFDWFDEVSTQIVTNQNIAGYFEYLDPLITEGEESTVLRTAWALLTLEKFIPPPPVEIEKYYTHTDVDFNPWHWECETVWFEDFDPCGPGWSIGDYPAHWDCSNTNYAGGDSPEAWFTYFITTPVSWTGKSWIESPTISTVGGYDKVEISFDQYVDLFIGTFILGVEASDGGPWTTVYSYEYDALVDDPIVTDGVTFELPEAFLDTVISLRFFFDGNIFNIDHWYIDNIEVTGCYIIPDPAELGTPLNTIHMVINKNKVRSHNPGQFYAVINITGPVQTFYFRDRFDIEFDVNPSKVLSGGVQVILLDPDGYAEVITDTPNLTIKKINNGNNRVNIEFHLEEELPPGYTLKVYIKFQTAYKNKPYGGDHQFWDKANIDLDDDGVWDLTTWKVYLPITGEGVPLPP